MWNSSVRNAQKHGFCDACIAEKQQKHTNAKNADLKGLKRAF
jgi:hypothetical protein